MERKLTRKDGILLTAALLLPALAVAWGIVLLFADTLFNKAFFITFLLIPPATVAIILFIVFSKKAFSRKVFDAVVFSFVFVISFFASHMLGTFEMLTYKADAEIGKSYEEVCEEFDMMPKAEELGNYDGLEHYDYFSSALGIFTCDADTLIARYTSADYEKQKALLDGKFNFNQDTENFSCILNGYSFRTLLTDAENDIAYPKKAIFIATNDEEKSISYTAFFNDDIDRIESLEDFLLDDCGWKHILK